MGQSKQKSSIAKKKTAITKLAGVSWRHHIPISITSTNGKIYRQPRIRGTHKTNHGPRHCEQNHSVTSLAHLATVTDRALLEQVCVLTCRQSRAGSTSLDCFVSKARRKGRITKSASEPSRMCPASARAAAAACPVLGLAGDMAGLVSSNFSSASLGLDGSPSERLSWTTDLHPLCTCH